MNGRARLSADEAVHAGFDFMLVLKTFFAIGEVACGIALFFLTPDLIQHAVGFFTGGELATDSTDFVATRLVAWADTFSLDTERFGMIYLISHGVAKLVVLALLWKGKSWSYPLSVTLFTAFIVYQLHRFVYTHSPMLIVLTVLDVVMIVLTILEYRRLRRVSCPPIGGGTPDAENEKRGDCI